MAVHKLQNYLRTYRKKTGLTQREVAFLLGAKSGAQVSRYEKRRRLPPLRTALACELVLGAPISQIFAGMRDDVNKEMEKRLVELRSGLRAKKGSKSEVRLNEQKLRWLDECRVPQKNQLTTACQN